MNSSKLISNQSKYEEFRNNGYPTHHWASVIRQIKNKCVAVVYADTGLPAADFGSPNVIMCLIINISTTNPTTTVNSKKYAITYDNGIKLTDNNGTVFKTAPAYELNRSYIGKTWYPVTHSTDINGNRGVIDKHEFREMINDYFLNKDNYQVGFNAMIELGAITDSNGMRCRFFLNWNGQIVYAARAVQYDGGDSGKPAPIGVWLPKLAHSKYAASHAPLNRKIW